MSTNKAWRTNPLHCGVTNPTAPGGASGNDTKATVAALSLPTGSSTHRAPSQSRTTKDSEDTAPEPGYRCPGADNRWRYWPDLSRSPAPIIRARMATPDPVSNPTEAYGVHVRSSPGPASPTLPSRVCAHGLSVSRYLLPLPPPTLALPPPPVPPPHSASHLAL